MIPADWLYDTLTLHDVVVGFGVILAMAAVAALATLFLRRAGD